MTLRSRLYSTAVALVATSLFSGCAGGEHEAHSRTPLPTVLAEVATTRTIDTADRIEVRGVVEADVSAAISSRVMAMVTRVRAVPGDRVRRGQVLVEIDPATARGQLGQANGALAQAEAALTLARRNFDRFEALGERDAASELEVDMARMQFEQAQGAVEQARGAVQAAESVASESSVRAPFDGLVVQKMVNVGDLAAPGRPLMILESAGPRRLVLSVPASVESVSALGLGDPIEARLDSRPDLGSMIATLVERSPTADPVTHSFTLKAELPDDRIPSGTSGRAWLRGPFRAAVVAPRNAVRRQGGLTLVIVRTEEGLSETRIVTTGSDIGDGEVEILSGLAGGESVLVDLPSVPPNGSPVKERT